MKWTRFSSRQGVDIATISGFDLVFFDLARRFGGKGELFFTHFKDKQFTHYIRVDPEKLSLAVFDECFDSPEKIKKYYEEGKGFIKEFVKTSKECKNKEIIDAFKIFRKQFDKVCAIYSIISFLAIEFWQNKLEKTISRMISKNNLEEQRNQIMSCIYKPWKKTALLEIQDKIEAGEDINSLVEQYQFLRSWSLVWYNAIDASWVKSLKKLKSKESHSMAEVLELLKPGKDEEKMILLATYVIFFKDWRDDLRRRFSYSWNFIFEKIADKLGIDYDDLGYLTLDEIEGSLKDSNVNIDLINIRKNGECIIASEKSKLKIKIFDGKVPKRYIEIIENVEKKVSNIEIKGLIAQNGKAKGTVRIMHSYHDMKKVNKGNILVANTTHPNYLPAMQKAAAFVTNEGGVVSHAAIISRELGKPCVVGTKMATRIINN